MTETTQDLLAGGTAIAVLIAAARRASHAVTNDGITGNIYTDEAVALQRALAALGVAPDLHRIATEQAAEIARLRATLSAITATDCYSRDEVTAMARAALEAKP
jgi:uncharacterized small protein (DUF1192 family)